MSDKLPNIFGISRAGDGVPNCSPAPRFEIGQVGGETAKRIRSFPVATRCLRVATSASVRTSARLSADLIGSTTARAANCFAHLI